MTKSEVISRALEMLGERVIYLKVELAALNHSKGEDTKSSAGDKFETGREMIAQEISKIESQLHQAQQQQHALFQIRDKKITSSSISSGSLVLLGEQWFFISVSLGEVFLEEDSPRVFLLSKLAPLGKLLLGKKEKDQVLFRGKPQLIQKVMN